MSSENRKSFKNKAKDKLSFMSRLKSGGVRVSEDSTDDEPRAPNHDGVVAAAEAARRPEVACCAVGELPVGRVPAAGKRNAAPPMPSGTSRREVNRKLKHVVQPKGTLTYQVGENDSLNSIALKCNCTPSELKKLNKLMSNYVFPSTVIFIPDPDYVPSDPPTPKSSPVKCPPVDENASGFNFPLSLSPPLSAPDLIQQMEKTRFPGHVVRDLSERRGSDEDDDECLQKFVKVNVKFITDGCGVISGVLLVTPNAVMFDPDVSDPLVLERGVEAYGVIAPMDSVVSVAMYHDIAAMKIGGRRSEENPVAYRACSVHLKDGRRSSTCADCQLSGENRSDQEQVATGEGLASSLSSQQFPANQTTNPSFEFPQPLPSYNESTTKTERYGMTDVHRDDDDHNDDDDSVFLDEPKIIAPKEAQKADGDCSAIGGEGTKTTEITHLPLKKVEVPPGDGDNASAAAKGVEVEDAVRPIQLSEEVGMRKVSISEEHPDGEKSKDVASVDDEGSASGDCEAAKTVQEAVKVARAEDDQANEREGPEGDTNRCSSSFDDEDKSLESGGLLSRTLSSIGSYSPNLSNLVNFPKFGRAVEVENAVKMSDKPELFRNFSELIPRPATEADEPPLYLCLRLSSAACSKPPRGKTAAAAVQSYAEKAPQPEYWFSIPRKNVDRLYAFFVQWSPEKYDSDSNEETAEKQGFFVVDTSEKMELDECHFEVPPHRSARSSVMDWELVNPQEARRRISILEDEQTMLPEMSAASGILDEEFIRKLSRRLPPRAEGYPWNLIYNTDNDGFSLKSLYRKNAVLDSPILLTIKDSADNVFGAVLSCPLKQSEHFYGTGESFLFTFYPEFKKFEWKGSNLFFVKGNAESLAIGAGEGTYGLWLDSDIYHGRTQTCLTFLNDPLTSSEDFVVKALEVWCWF